MTLTTPVLEVAIADAWWVELLRWVSIFVGGAMVGFAPIVAILQWETVKGYTRQRKAGLVAFIAAGLFAVLQEADQLHHPMLWWRLPLLLIIVLTGAFAMFWPDQDGPPRQ